MSDPPAFTQPPLFAAEAAVPLDRAIHSVPLAVVDVETTGLSPERGDRVIEIAVLRADPDGRVDLWSSLVNPGRRIDPRASAVNGISDADVAGQPHFGDLVGLLRARLHGAVLVAHNAPFDLGFLASEHKRAGRALPLAPVIDTLVLARRWFDFPSNSLGQVARVLNIPVDRAHRAGGDVTTTHRVLQHMIEALAPHGFATVEDFVRGYPPAIEGDSVALPTLDEPLATALRERRAITIRYAGGAKTTVRVVEPILAMEDRMIAYCRLRREERTFRFARIRAAWWPE
jgi:DNA polymerase-3 subunit epsilon